MFKLHICQVACVRPPSAHRGMGQHVARAKSKYKTSISGQVEMTLNTSMDVCKMLLFFLSTQFQFSIFTLLTTANMPQPHVHSCYRVWFTIVDPIVVFITALKCVFSPAAILEKVILQSQEPYRPFSHGPLLRSSRHVMGVHRGHLWSTSARLYRPQGVANCPSGDTGG